MKKILQIVLNALKINAFSQSAEGQNILTDAQRDSLTKTFGKEFVAKFESNILNAPSTQTQEDGVNAVVELITESQTPTIEALQAQLSASQSENSTLRQTVAALSDIPELEPAAQALQNGVENHAREFKANLKTPFYQGAVNYLGAAGGATPTIDTAELKTEFGLYMAGARQTDLFKQVFMGFETSKYMSTRIADHEWRATQGLINSVVQQFNPKWTPSGKVKFTPISIRNRRHKINVALRPNDIVESWLLYMYDESLSPDKMPITRYIIQEMILPKILEDIEMRMIGKGKYDETASAALADGDAGVAPEKGMDGFETILSEALKVKGTAADMGVNFIEMAATFDYRTCTAKELLDFVAKFVDYVSPYYKRKDMPVFCSEDFYKRYKRAYKEVWGAGSGTSDPNFGGDRIDYSTMILTPLQSMFASPILFTTPKENFIKLRREKETSQLINDVQKVNYDVKLFGEFWMGCGFAIGEAVTAYVPADYDPHATISACLGTHDSLSPNRWLGSNAVHVEVPAENPASNEEGGA